MPGTHTYQMVENELQQSGLTPVETKIYLTILELGSASANDVARKSGIHRRSVYDAMERLIEKGLVAYMKEDEHRVYQAADPERLLSRIDEQRRDLQKILPELKLKYSMSKEHEQTLFYKGKEGLKTIFAEQIEDAKEVMVFGGNLRAGEIIKYYFPKYTTRRVEKKIAFRIIYCSDDRREEPIPLAKVRYLPAGYGSLAATNVWGDKVAILIWTENPLGILIKNREVAKAYKEYFELLWGLAKE